MAFGLDGSATGTASNTSSFTVSGTLTTVSLNDIIAVLVVSSSNTPWPASTSLSDTSGLAWTKSLSVNSQVAAGQYQTLDYWYSQYTPGTLTADSLTVTLNQTVDSCSVLWFGVQPAAVQSTKFDGLGSANPLPLYTTGTSSIPSITFTDNHNTCMVVGLYGGITDVTTAGTGFTLIGHTTVTGASYTTSVAAQYQIYSTQQVGVACPFGTSSTGWIEIVDGYISTSGTTGVSVAHPPHAAGVSVAGISMRAGNSGFESFGYTIL